MKPCWIVGFAIAGALLGSVVLATVVAHRELEQCLFEHLYRWYTKRASIDDLRVVQEMLTSTITDREWRENCRKVFK